jgi:hypothetical protein
MLRVFSLFSALTLLLVLTLSCSTHQQPDVEAVKQPESETNSAVEEQEQANVESKASDETAEQLAESDVDNFIRQVVEEATLLRTDGQRLTDEND